MFILSTIQDLIQITPQDFERPSAQAIKDAIHAKYANRVVQKVGLCISMYDLLEASEGLIGHGTGLVNVNVTFRMVVFRPFRGEIIQGRIVKSDEEGIYIDLEFTQEVFVPVIFLRLPYHENELALWLTLRRNRGEEAWVWNSEGEEFFYDKGEQVRLRVEQEVWEDQGPGVKDPEEEDEEEDSGLNSAYRIIGSMNQPGLGPLLWWQEQDEGAPTGNEMEE